MTLQFSESKVEYASHQLSLYYGECPHKCEYCFVDKIYRKRNWKWACGEYRLNEKAFDIAKHAPDHEIEMLVVSFTSDPFPKYSHHIPKTLEAFDTLKRLLLILNSREIPTKVLTKNGAIQRFSHYSERYEHIQFGMSMTTNYRNHHQVTKWEPHASNMWDRYTSLQLLKMHGFRTWISAEPILPKTDLFAFLLNMLSCNPEEIWIGKGSYDKEISHAVDWVELVNMVESIKKHNTTHTKIHLKKELTDYVEKRMSNL